jgi:hypothetical protein
MTKSAPQGWPAYPDTDPDVKDLAVAVYNAELVPQKSRLETNEARYRSQFDSETELFKNFHTTLRDMAKSAASRVDTLAQLVQTAAGAIVTLYTGVLALVFAAGGTELPLRALIPAVFLGLAVVLAAAYAAFLTPIDDTLFVPRSRPRENAMRQTQAIQRYVRIRNNTRVRAIRSAVVSLGLGVLFLPAAFVAIGSSEAPSTTSYSVDYPPIPADAPADALPDLYLARYQAQVTETSVIRAAERDVTPAPRTVDIAGVRLQLADVLIGALALILALIGFTIAARYRVPVEPPPDDDFNQPAGGTAGSGTAARATSGSAA